MINLFETIPEAASFLAEAKASDGSVTTEQDMTTALHNLLSSGFYLEHAVILIKFLKETVSVGNITPATQSEQTMRIVQAIRNREDFAMLDTLNNVMSYVPLFNSTREAIEFITSDGKLTLPVAGTLAECLLTAKFSLNEAVELIWGLKSIAKLRHNKTERLGQAILSTIWGIRYLNSVLADTLLNGRNLLVILNDEGYFKTGAYSKDELSCVTDIRYADPALRTALFKGIMEDIRFIKNSIKK